MTSLFLTKQIPHRPYSCFDNNVSGYDVLLHTMFIYTNVACSAVNSIRILLFY